jgi:hypothetical protein
MSRSSSRHGSDSGARSGTLTRSKAAARRSSLLLLLVALVAACCLPARVASQAVTVQFESKPTQNNLPWAVTYTWATPTKTAWPAALSYLYSATGVTYFTVTATRTASVTQGSLQGAAAVQRGSPEASGGMGQLVVSGATIELWQANGAEGVINKIASAPCLFDPGNTPTYTFATPGTSARCVFTFNAPFGFDPEQKAELRVGSVTYSTPTNFPSTTGLPVYALEPYSATTSPNRCASVLDTMSFATSADRPTPFVAGAVTFAQFGTNSLPKPPAAPGTGTEICGTSYFRYTATFPSVGACSATAYAVRARRM